MHTHINIMPKGELYNLPLYTPTSTHKHACALTKTAHKRNRSYRHSSAHIRGHGAQLGVGHQALGAQNLPHTHTQCVCTQVHGTHRTMSCTTALRHHPNAQCASGRDVDVRFRRGTRRTRATRPTMGIISGVAMHLVKLMVPAVIAATRSSAPTTAAPGQHTDTKQAQKGHLGVNKSQSSPLYDLVTWQSNKPTT